jgi:hypothetical protein
MKASPAGKALKVKPLQKALSNILCQNFGLKAKRLLEEFAKVFYVKRIFC